MSYSSRRQNRRLKANLLNGAKNTAGGLAVLGAGGAMIYGLFAAEASRIQDAKGIMKRNSFETCMKVANNPVPSCHMGLEQIVEEQLGYAVNLKGCRNKDAVLEGLRVAKEDFLDEDAILSLNDVAKTCEGDDKSM